MAPLIQSLVLVVIVATLQAAAAPPNNSSQTFVPNDICHDCLCYVEDCKTVGFDFCHPNQCNTPNSKCKPDHCCCCEKPIETCTDEPCTCIDYPRVCSDMRDMKYCDEHKCKQQCGAAQCCCHEEVQCPVWSECHCMTQKCSEVANLHDCDRCCSDCEFGHCCCCDDDRDECPKDSECHCEDRPCDEKPGFGFCDPRNCSAYGVVPSTSFTNGWWQNYVCPDDQCCCKMEQGVQCKHGKTCTCERRTCWELGYGYCDCDDLPGCREEHCCCPYQVEHCSTTNYCMCIVDECCEFYGYKYCDPTGIITPGGCPPERLCCRDIDLPLVRETPEYQTAVGCTQCRCGDCINDRVPFCAASTGVLVCPGDESMCCYNGETLNVAVGACSGMCVPVYGAVCAERGQSYCSTSECKGMAQPGQCCCEV